MVFLGKICTSNGFVIDAKTFAQNAKYKSPEINLSINSLYNFYHNIGCDFKNLKISGWIKDRVNGTIMPWCVDSSIDYNYDKNNYGYHIDDCNFLVRTTAVLMQYKSPLGINTAITANSTLILEIERSFE